jgi:hypothetical protein
MEAPWVRVGDWAGVGRGMRASRRVGRVYRYRCIKILILNI